MNARRVIVRIAAAGILALSGLAASGTAASASPACRYYYDQSAYFQVLGTNSYAAAQVYYANGDYTMASAFFNQAAAFYSVSRSYLDDYRTCIQTP